MGTKVMFVYNFDGGVNFCENIFLRIVKRIAKNSCHVALLQCLLALNAVSDVFFFLFRWSVSFKQTNSEDIGDPPPLDIINNYFSIGVVRASHI